MFIWCYTLQLFIILVVTFDTQRIIQKVEIIKVIERLQYNFILYHGLYCWMGTFFK